MVGVSVISLSVLHSLGHIFYSIAKNAFLVEAQFDQETPHMSQLLGSLQKRLILGYGRGEGAQQDG